MEATCTQLLATACLPGTDPVWHGGTAEGQVSTRLVWKGMFRGAGRGHRRRCRCGAAMPRSGGRAEKGSHAVRQGVAQVLCRSVAQADRNERRPGRKETKEARKKGRTKEQTRAERVGGQCDSTEWSVRRAGNRPPGDADGARTRRPRGGRRRQGGNETASGRSRSGWARKVSRHGLDVSVS